MNWLTILMICCPVGSAGEDSEVELARQARTAIEEVQKSWRSRAEAAEVVNRFVDRYPQSKQAAVLLRDLIDLYEMGIPVQRAAALKAARRLIRDCAGPYPDESRYEPSSSWKKTADRFWPRYSLHEIAGWYFSSFPQHLTAGVARPIIFSRSGNDGPPSSIVVYYVPTAAMQKLLQKTSEQRIEHQKAPRRDAQVDPLALWKDVDRQQWIEVARATLTFPRDADNETYVDRVVDADLSRPGLYVVREEIDGFAMYAPLRVLSFGAVTQIRGCNAYVFTVDVWSGLPVPGVKVTASMGKRSVQRVTDADGLARIEGFRPGYLILERDSEIDTLPLFDLHKRPHRPWHLVYVTTDRPIYRPGQRVQFKALMRVRLNENLSLPSMQSVRVVIRDPQRRVLETQEHQLSQFGSLAGSFQLAPEPPLGRYEINVESPGLHEGISFDVEEYRRPEMALDAQFHKPSHSAKATLQAKLSASYYFGGPVANAEVRWVLEARHRSTDSWPCDVSELPWQLPVEDQRYWFFDNASDRWGRFRADEDLWCWDEGEIVAEGEGRTDSEGTLWIRPAVKARSEPVKYVLKTTVTDLSRRTATATASTVADDATLRIDSHWQCGIDDPDSATIWLVRVTTPDGKPVAGKEVTVFLSREETSDSNQESGPDRQQLKICPTKAVTEESGIARVLLQVGTPGEYYIHAQVSDDRDRVVEHRSRISEWLEPPTSSPRAPFQLRAQRQVYQPGDTARLTVVCPHAPATALMTLDSSAGCQVRTVKIERSPQVIEVPLNAGHVPDLQITLATWSKGKCVASGTTLLVYPQEQLLDVSITTDRERYRPGERAEIELTTRSLGQPVPAEIELSVVDESLLALRRNSDLDIRQFFFPWHQSDLQTRATCRSSDLIRKLGPSICGWTGGGSMDGFAGFGGGGIGGAAAKELAPARLRQSFAETMYWNAHVQTGQDGKALVPVEISDSLTKWRILARAAAGADRFGLASARIVTRQNVTLRLAKPRFYVQGDVGTVATIVNSKLSKPTEFRVRLKAKRAQLDRQEQSIIVPANSERRLDWQVRAADKGEIVFRAEALSTRESDAVRVSVPVHPATVAGTVHQSGLVADTWRATLSLPQGADPATATLELVVSPPGVLAAKEALPYLAEYPYGCVEQTMSRFLPAVIATRTMKRLGIDDRQLQEKLPGLVSSGLQRLYGFQHDDGGWGWWKQDRTDAFMSAYVVFGLAVARQAGFAVDEETLKRGVGALRTMEQTPFLLYARSLGGDNVKTELRPADKAITDKDHSLAATEARAYLVLAGRRDLAGQLCGQPPPNVGPNELRVTALAIRAIASVDPTDRRLSPLIEWLMKQRRGAAWFSTLDTAYSIYALSEIAAECSAPTFSVTVNGHQIAPAGRVVDREHLKAGPNTVEVHYQGRQRLFTSASLHYGIDVSHADLGQSGQGFKVYRRLERQVFQDGQIVYELIEPGDTVSVGDEVRVTTVANFPTRGAERVMLESPIAAGLELPPVQDDSTWLADRIEYHDEKVTLARSQVKGRHELQFRARAILPGRYSLVPAVVYEMYDPRHRGISDSFVLRIVDRAKGAPP